MHAATGTGAARTARRLGEVAALVSLPQAARLKLAVRRLAAGNAQAAQP
jgi:hypothetical protein